MFRGEKFMSAEESVVLEPLAVERLHEVLQSGGPCITLLMPPYHPGEPTGSGAALLRANLQEAERQLGERAFAKAAAEDLLEPVRRLTTDAAWLGGAHSGCAIFRSPEVFCQLPLTQPPKQSLTVAGCFAIRHLLNEFSVAKPFYILALSKESVSLFRYFESQAQAVSIPGTPMTLKEALELEPPDHDLENRSAAGSSPGSMHRIRFGTGSGRETAKTHLADFYKLVDRGIHKLLHAPGIPLILAGVDEDMTLYRAVSGYTSLVKGRLHRGPGFSLTDAETITQARSLLREQELERQAKALNEAKEHTGRVATDMDVITHAAFDGRVHELYVDQGSVMNGIFDKQGYHSWGTEDLLNFAVVETLLHRGKAFELPGGKMPAGVKAVAILRF